MCAFNFDAPIEEEAGCGLPMDEDVVEDPAQSSEPDISMYLL